MAFLWLFVFLAAIPLASTSGGREPKKVVLHAAAQTGAVCLDGSPALYYLRPGVGAGASKWLIYHEGGAWCYSLEDCLERSRKRLGSSLYDPDTVSENVLATDYFSTEPSSNPLMWNWNLVFLRYCDGASFTGRNLTETVYQGHVLHFRGMDILEAVLEDLLARGLQRATDVVISGCSAGGLAAFIHADWWADNLKDRCESPPKVVGMPDSGFFLNYDGPLHYPLGMQGVYLLHNSSAGVLPSCYDFYKQTGEDWKCLFAQYTAPFIQTPLFLLQSLYDTWQVWVVLNQSEPAAIRMFAGLLREQLAKDVLSNPRHGNFLDACPHHCITGMWNWLQADGTKISDAFQEWYTNGPTLPRKGRFEQSSCQSCCASRNLRGRPIRATVLSVSETAPCLDTGFCSGAQNSTCCDSCSYWSDIRSKNSTAWTCN